MEFEIRTKRRRYIIYVDFHDDQYELDIVGVFGRSRKNIGGWEEIPITSNPLDVARAEVKKFELKEDYIDALDDKVFPLDEEAEAAVAAEVEEKTHAIPVTDWLSGKRKVVYLKR